MKQDFESKLRQEVSNQSIWFPLPNDILDIVFNPAISRYILGNLTNGLGSNGSWNRDYGIYTHNKSGMLYCLIADQNGLASIRRFIKSNRSIEELAANPMGLDAIKVQAEKVRYAETIGRLVAIGQPYEYKANHGEITQLIERHFGPDAGYVFIRTQGANHGGVIRLHSVPSSNVQVDIPGSHPILIEEQLAVASQKNVINSGLPSSDLDEINSQITAMFSNLDSSKLVPNPNPDKPFYELQKQVVTHGGLTSFLEPGPKRQLPTMTIGEGSVVDSATTRLRGHHSEATRNGLHSNPFPCRPSASFHPHAYWNESLFTSPTGVLKDPTTAATIIAIALLLSDGKDHTQYIVNYKRTQKVIDNETIDKDLYG
jgi:hypothetical protein